jgi:glucosylglycerate phosphorylase
MNPAKFHLLEPDYSNPILEISKSDSNKLKEKLEILYGEKQSKKSYKEIERLLKVYYAHKTPEMIDWEKGFENANRLSEKDAILITYGDLINDSRQPPLETLSEISKKYFKSAFNTIHILPFFPYSSDRGFAIMDFEEVDPNLGNWDDIINLKQDFRLMFDGVFNHVSSKSRWFQEFLNQNEEYAEFFTVFNTKQKISHDHLNLIVRPRTSDILTGFDTLNGSRLVWTTFSPDQIDLDFHNHKVLEKIIEILLMYVRRGADLIRLDAVTYLWEELGTSCAHLDQNHITIQLLRDILDIVSPHVALITETNVTHEDNIKYFGNGCNEAQMVYNFALPPLVLHTFQTENSKKLSDWASGLKPVSEAATYFNFLDSHDGIGVMAAKGILTKEEIEIMALKVLEHGGYISYKDEGDGSVSPYELNITWFSAINREDDNEPIDLQVKRYIASRSIALVIMGVPGIYLHGLFGSKNEAEQVLIEKDRRSINRKNISREELLKALNNKNSCTNKITNEIVHLLKIRKLEKAFHPNAEQKIIQISDSIFCVKRTIIDTKSVVFAYVNVTNKNQKFRLELSDENLIETNWNDIISDKKYKSEKHVLEIPLEPYDIGWLKPI